MADTVAFSFETYANAWTVHDEYTFIYKHASGVDIPVDVFVPTSPEAKAACAQRGGSLPVLFWIHGGGGLQGGRTERYQHLLEAVNKTAFVGVFPDYRLCPQVRIGDLLEDVADAFKWTVTSLPGELRQTDPTAPALELDQIIVQGNSMGGYLSLCLPLGALPALHISDPKSHPFLARIRGTIPLYPVVDYGDPFWSAPRPAFGGDLPEWVEELMKPYIDPSGPVITNTHPEGPSSLSIFPRNMMYPWTQTKANLRSLLFGPDRSEQEDWLAKLNLYDHLKRHADQIKTIVGSACRHPSTLKIYIVHGDKDAAVPVDQSRNFVKLARNLEFEVTYEEFPGADHMFDAQPDLEMKSIYTWARDLTPAQ